ncbi:uncharacterized protein LOC128782706 isoform X3 [Vidua chalybeata]|nr:uncharacterized protein LOC128782706 isoform X3 [Vidua chalybeata]
MTSRPLLPGRFLAMAAHLGMLMRMGGDPPKLPSGDPEPGFWGALGGSLALLGVEFLGFFSGVSMFHPGQSLACILGGPQKWGGDPKNGERDPKNWGGEPENGEREPKNGERGPQKWGEGARKWERDPKNGGGDPKNWGGG